MIAAATPTIETPAATAAAPASADAPPAGFDAILMLQALAGTDTLETADFETGLLEDSTDDTDETDDDIESSLAFLANLIAATIPLDSSSRFQTGAGGTGQGGDAAALLSLPGDADGAFALAALGLDDGKAESLLTAVDPESLDSRQGSGDASQNLARAAELLAQGARPAAETSKLVATHVREPRWADDFSGRISLMVRAGESTASLQLTPVDMGPVEVNVSVKDSQATIHFGASQADTRALIEASLPRLRELLAAQGFNLMDASVSSGFSRSKQSGFSAGPHGNGEQDAAPTEVVGVRRQLGLLDLYA